MVAGGEATTSMILVIVLTAVALTLHIGDTIIVNQNLVFTHPNLNASSIPYYNGNATMASQMDRYQVEWWMFASDAFRVITPVFALIYFMVLITSKNLVGTFFYHFMMTLILCGELGKLIYRSWQYAQCGSYQMCRGYSPDNPTSPNYVWLVAFFTNVAFVVITALFNLLAKHFVKAGISSGLTGARVNLKTKMKRMVNGRGEQYTLVDNSGLFNVPPKMH